MILGAEPSEFFVGGRSDAVAGEGVGSFVAESVPPVAQAVDADPELPRDFRDSCRPRRRVFDAKLGRAAYTKQTQAAKGKSNCPLCAVGHDSNKSRTYKFEEMDADHVSAWSKGGDSSAKNCQMLCSTHNRAKGNR